MIAKLAMPPVATYADHQMWNRSCARAGKMATGVVDTQVCRAKRACVDVEQVVAGHAGLPRHAGRDEHQVAPVQRARQLLRPHEAGHLRGHRHISIRSGPLQAYRLMAACKSTNQFSQECCGLTASS